jgi:hypothetical protein
LIETEIYKSPDRTPVIPNEGNDELWSWLHFFQVFQFSTDVPLLQSIIGQICCWLNFRTALNRPTWSSILQKVWSAVTVSGTISTLHFAVHSSEEFPFSTLDGF